VVQPARIAWLDAPFAVAVRRCRSSGRGPSSSACNAAPTRLAVTQAIAHFTRVDDRVLALLWHLAERWGRMRRRPAVLEGR